MNSCPGKIYPGKIYLVHDGSRLKAVLPEDVLDTETAAFEGNEVCEYIRNRDPQIVTIQRTVTLCELPEEDKK
jgi:hypothetical protein